MNVDEIEKVIAAEREAIEAVIKARHEDIAACREVIKDMRAKLDRLPRLAVKRTRKAKVAT